MVLVHLIVRLSQLQISLLIATSLASQCSENCIDCAAQGVCQKCDHNSATPMLHNGVCVRGCPPKTLQVLDQCLTCHESCDTCFGVQANQCSSCHGSDILQNWECVKPSIQGNCSQNCESCDSEHRCIECSGTMKLFNGECLEECPGHHFMDYELINHRQTHFKCLPCQPSCNTCHGPSQKDCLTCDNSSKEHGIFHQGECVAKCPQGFFERSGVCFRMPEHCLSASTTLTLCDQCESPYLVSGGHCVLECPDTKYPENGVCKNCHKDCERCTSLDTCTRCRAPQKLLNGACTGQCPQGTYVGFEIEHSREVDQKCLPCDPTCLTCSGPLDNRCASCDQENPEHAISLEGRCVASCPAGFVERAKVCFYCGINCQTCSNPENPNECDTCKPGYELNGTDCVKSCPEGTFALNDKCEKCSDDCKRCKSAHQCDECQAPAKLFQNKCIATCPVGTFTNVTAIVDQRESDLKCLPCDSTCRSCSGSDPNQCLSCSRNDQAHDTFLEGKCVAFCPRGFVERAHTCFMCGATCESCSNPLDVNECDYCKSGFVFYNKQCVPTCPQGTYDYHGKCIPCGNDCKRCDSEISCQECNAPSKLYDGFCLSRCPDGTYVNATIIDHHFQDQKCLACDATCQTCSGPEPNRCSSCDQTDPLHDTSLQGKCVDSCPSGFVEQSKVCFYCGQNCATCSNPFNTNECDTCKPGFLLNGKQCVESCPVGTFQSGNECIPCNDGCLSCSSLTQCTECEAPSRLYEGSCISECPVKTYLNFTIVDQHESDLKCLPCDKSCHTCSGPELNQCISCDQKERSHDTMLQGKCVASCPIGYVERAKTCFLCDSSCETCSNPDDTSFCDTCKFGYILYENRCISGCPKGTYETKTTCKPCSQNCLKCVSDKVCEECENPFSLYKDKCVHQCPTHFFTNVTKIINHREADLQCEPCHSTCRTCTGSDKDRCLSCDTRSRKHSTFLEGECVQGCPSEFFVLNPHAKVCMHCGPNCKTCDDYLNPQICSSCQPGFLMSDSKCVSTCPEGTYQDGTDCKPCEAHCATCNSATQCTSCSGDYELLGEDCVLNCPVGTFEQHGICRECPTCCSSCSSLSECSTCAENYFFLNNYCVEACPDGTYGADGQCNSCSSSCKTCSDADTCLSCDHSNPQQDTFFQGTCIDSCPEIPDVYQTSEYECQFCPTEVTQVHHKSILQTLINCDLSIRTAQDLKFVAQRLETYYDAFTAYFVLETESLWQRQAKDLIESSRNLLIQALVTDAMYEGKHLSISRSPLGVSSLQDDFKIGSTVHMQISVPQSAIQQFDKAHLGSSCFVSGVYTDSAIGEYEIPLCDISILSNGIVQRVQNLKEDIEIKFTFDKLPANQPLSCAYWDPKLKEFSTSGIATTRSENVITCGTPHLSSFQIIPSEPVISSPSGLSSLLILLCTLGFCLLLLILTLLVDFACLRHKELPYYPHLSNQNNKTCLFIFKYSFLYNFPIVSLFSFQEPNLRAYSRAFWFTDLLIVMLNIIGLLFSNEILKCDPNTANEFIISFCLGLCLIPGSFIINLLAIKVRKATSKDDTQIFLAASVVNSTNQTRFIRRKCGVILLAVVTFCVYVGGCLNLYFLQLSDSFVLTFGIAVAAGCIFSLLKITLASVVAYKHHHNPGMMFDLCVDVMTDMVTSRTRQSNPDATYLSSQHSRTTFNN